MITQQSSPTDAYKKFDTLANKKLSAVLKTHQTMLVSIFINFKHKIKKIF